MIKRTVALALVLTLMAGCGKVPVDVTNASQGLVRVIKEYAVETAYDGFEGKCVLTLPERTEIKLSSSFDQTQTDVELSVDAYGFFAAGLLWNVVDRELFDEGTGTLRFKASLGDDVFTDGKDQYNTLIPQIVTAHPEIFSVDGNRTIMRFGENGFLVWEQVEEVLTAKVVVDPEKLKFAGLNSDKLLGWESVVMKLPTSEGKLVERSVIAQIIEKKK